jgi:hypothetical protein
MTTNELIERYLDFDERMKFKHNMNNILTINEENGNGVHFITTSFVWSNTPEGEDYWYWVDYRVGREWGMVKEKEPIVYRMTKHRMI